MENANDIRWGILGCGDVCEVKSGPAFNKVAHSKLVAVMRRDAEKAMDFARRHRVPRYYSDAQDLIHDKEVDAIYIATPPAFHEEYALQSMDAGKPVYIEKPVALNSESCERIIQKSRSTGVPASVAHYRRGLPLFKKIRSLLESGRIGKPSLIVSKTFQAPGNKIHVPGYWRTSPDISGGGLFFDLAPHQLDIFYWLFGKPTDVRGRSINQRRLYSAPDLTSVEAMFGDDVYLHALWSFNLDGSADEETTEVMGDKGKLAFSFFRPTEIIITNPGVTERIAFESPENIQQPMIEEVVNFFRGKGPNPCSLEDALVTMRMMDTTTRGDLSVKLR
jgi:predicted dehydrogenase